MKRPISKIIRTKKGGVPYTLVIFIGVILSAGVLLYLVSLIISGFGEKSVEEVCRGNVIFRTSEFFGDQRLGPLLCQTQKVELRGNKETVKEQIAELMRKCWYMFDEGKSIDALDGESVKKALGWEDNKNGCFTCFIADTAKIDGGPILPHELFTYLEDVDHPTAKGLKYLDYIQSYGGDGAVLTLSPVMDNQVYGISFLSKSKDDSKWTWGDSAATAALVTGTLAVKAGVAICGTVIGCPVGVIVGGAGAAVTGLGYLATGAYHDAKNLIYEEERAVSTITFDTLQSIERAGCEQKEGIR